MAQLLRPPWQRSTILVAGYLVLWLALDWLSLSFFQVTGFRPWYPPVALDVLLLVVFGWRWWPLLPLAAVVQWLLFSGFHSAPYANITTHVIAGIAYGACAWYVAERARVQRPIATVRRMAWLLGMLGFVAPAITGVLSAIAFIFYGQYSAGDFLLQASRFIVTDVCAVIVIVPIVLGFLDWQRIGPPAETRVQDRSELSLVIGATVILVALGYGVAVLMPSALLDLSFVAIAWLAIRNGLRGAILGVLAADVTATFVGIGLHIQIATLMQYHVFLIASAVMAQLLGALTFERWALSERLARRAFNDELTGLPNREHVLEWLDERRDSPLVLVLVDIDDMRLLNEGVGRLAADGALHDIAVRLRGGLPSSHLVARMSADEFVVAVVDERSPHALMSEVRSYFEAPFTIGETRIFVSVALGAVRVVRAGAPEETIRKAEVALHRAQRSPTRAIVYSPDLSGEGPLLVGELHRAMERGEIVPFFQPIFEYRADRWHLSGAEALLRWLHPERGIVAPSSFFDLLERLSLSADIGWTLLEQSVQQAAVWRRTIQGFRVWVNLFFRQALDPNCAQRIGAILEHAGAPADALVVEISERIVATEERDIVLLASNLRAMGVDVAIDDFGTGGSSLGRVRELPAQVLKVDRAFVALSEVDPKAKAVASTVVRLAADLGMDVVALGVENPMQLAVMIECGCRYAQGFALGQPLPAELFAREFLQFSRAS